jgi:biotin carboxyl carrier protein
MKISFWLNGKEHKLNITGTGGEDRVRVEMGGCTYQVKVEFLCPDEALLNIDGKIYDVFISANSRTYSVGVGAAYFHIKRQSASQILGEAGSQQGRKEVKTSMPGRIIKILASEGDRVEEGQAVLILEAMKMQNEIKSPRAGTVKFIKPKAGDSIETGGLLFVVE